MRRWGSHPRFQDARLQEYQRVIAAVIIFVSLGVDTFAVALGLGLSGLPRVRWARVGLTFACFEGFMPLIGLLIGQELGAALGALATYVAAGILIVLGARELREALTDDDDDDDAPLAALQRTGDRALLLTGLAISLDELAVGFTLGVLRAPLGPALTYIAVQAFVLTFAGLSLGQRLGVRLKERAELVAGGVLLLLGVALVVGEVTGARFL